MSDCIQCSRQCSLTVTNSAERRVPSTDASLYLPTTRLSCGSHPEGHSNTCCILNTACSQSLPVTATVSSSHSHSHRYSHFQSQPQSLPVTAIVTSSHSHSHNYSHSHFQSEPVTTTVTSSHSHSHNHSHFQSQPFSHSHSHD
jgi:hypothetical protein